MRKTGWDLKKVGRSVGAGARVGGNHSGGGERRSQVVDLLQRKPIDMGGCLRSETVRVEKSAHVRNSGTDNGGAKVVGTQKGSYYYMKENAGQANDGCDGSLETQGRRRSDNSCRPISLSNRKPRMTRRASKCRSSSSFQVLEGPTDYRDVKFPGGSSLPPVSLGDKEENADVPNQPANLSEEPPEVPGSFTYRYFANLASIGKVPRYHWTAYFYVVALGQRGELPFPG
ncbi:hypothetical protein B0H66DRAFT_625571 [Apodospora peruviana]|uniref:Uncharacterized protein n=1 Tax=Apodospora peruviana TaxID=516989 RepID=A0AAE0M219_9PEZI|nr:hypothetical protein B0H66DRAFT_625571 [Apodospora peruviana]